MKRGLELFIESIEKCYQKRFIPRVVLIPMAKPAYKEVTIEVYLMHGANKELYVKASNVYMVTNEDEKEKAIDDLTQDIIALVLKKKA